MRRRLVALCILGAISMPQGVTALSHAQTAPLQLKVPSYQVQNASIIEALHALKLRVEKNFLIFGLEVVPFIEEPERNLTLALENTTVNVVLQRILAQDPRYTYEVIDPHLIHVFPRSAKHDPTNLLNLQVKRFAVSTGRYDLLLKYPSYHIQELQAELLRRSKAGGVVGHMLGDPDAPRVTVTIENATVRDILNRIAQETEKFATEHHKPTGWIYTFRIDKSVPLGGHPRWTLF